MPTMSRGVYVDRDALKRTLVLTGTSFADYDLDPAIAAASRAVDEYCGRQFDRDITQAADRWYRPLSGLVIVVDDLYELTTLTTYRFGTASNEKIWTSTPGLISLEPLNAIEDGYPYTRIVLNPAQASEGFPHWAPKSAKVTGKWGWPALPDQVVTASTLLATRLLKRVREAPFGIIAVGMDVGAAIRIARTDPEVATLLAPYVREKVISHIA